MAKHTKELQQPEVAQISKAENHVFLGAFHWRAAHFHKASFLKVTTLLRALLEIKFTSKEIILLITDLYIIDISSFLSSLGYSYSSENITALINPSVEPFIWLQDQLVCWVQYFMKFMLKEHSLHKTLERKCEH